MKILIIKLSSIGDLFHALPAVHNLKSELKADIDWVTHDAYVDLVKCFSDVDRVIPFYRHSFFRNFGTFCRELRASEYDFIIDLQGLLKSAVTARLARGGKRIGPSFYREGARIFYSAVAGRRNKERHAVEENLDIIDYFGLKNIEPQFPVSFPVAEMKGSAPRIGVVPASRWETKDWPTERFIETIKLVKAKQPDATFYLFGGPGEKELCASMEAELDFDVVNMAGKSTLMEMGGVLKELDLLISNDSGPVHMAVAVGTPCVVVFGPTDPDRTGPYGPANRVVKTELGCQPCFSRTCRRDSVLCMEGVLPDEVAEQALKLLNKDL